MIRKNVTITEDQEKWLKTNHINFSRWIQDKLDEERKKK